MSRIEEIERLRSRMRQHHFVAISGPRNCGKTRICHELKQSLEAEVRNMREIDRKYKAKAGMRWKVAYIKLTREDNPFDLLTRAIAGPRSNILVGANEKVDPLFESHVKTALMRPDGSGLLEIYQKFLKLKQTNFLVIIDQLENLFFSTILGQAEKSLFVRMLLSSSYTQRQLYVTVALRPPKADLWKQNFRELNAAVDICRFRLYNPNQLQLEKAIGNAFLQEKGRVLGVIGDDDLLQPDWLQKQEIYKRVALKRIRQIAEDLYSVLKGKWKKMQRDPNAGATRMVPSSNVKVITKQLRGVVDAIWPQLLLTSNVGNLAEEERQDLVDDLKDQMVDVLTAELLQKLSRLLAEELYFEREPLVQIEKNVRQLVRDWGEVLQDIRKESGRRKRKIQTVTLSEQRGAGSGVTTSDFRIDTSGPVHERAEKTYVALRSPLDKRIARKIFQILGRTASFSSDASLSVESLHHAIGRFASRINDVLDVFMRSGVLEILPEGELRFESTIRLGEGDLVNTWSRLGEWINGPDSSSSSTSTGSQRAAAPEPETISMELPGSFGDAPETASEYIDRAEAVYSALVPSIRKRVCKRLFVTMARMDKDNKGVNQNQLIAGIGRFEAYLKEIIELFISQGVLHIDGSGLRFGDPTLPTAWDRMVKWMKE